ncbi:hypothetical protein BDY17DRAFT_294968 [Neohortaea acidophila]|uniref:Protein N-terminal and lysine N-methyltransferase EFM7 n=1 Tax=Neohortaea acidophila TaxID=245834 RepID=A0A6A6PWI9_9PEZI|nr:uncharacterized protein BDY17DRAFT_294968 [Neohortaea acidophila]KAF2484094.1 hypothetical protein BDY17DRAFT_294968 [Neohortaea acidophila]
MSDGDASQDGELNIFEAPEGYYPPEKQPTSASYRTLSGVELRLRLIGHSPLWGHLLWNAGRTLATYLEQHAQTLIANKTVLELGAGAGLPSLICALHGAQKVLVTDYPEAELIENLRLNVASHAHLFPQAKGEGVIYAEGYLWGAEARGLLDYLSPAAPGSQAGFDLLILGDLLFNHSEHAKLLSTVRFTLKRSASAQALVFFTPYRPWLLEADLAFFDLARAGGFVVEKLMEHVMEQVMFDEDPGDEGLRRTVFGYSLRWDLAGETDGKGGEA